MKQNLFSTDARRWAALLNRDRRADGAFVYAVRTTGVYCRPTCGAKLPRRENVTFYLNAEAAEDAGFRPCRRCHPREAQRNGSAEAVVRACAVLSANEPPAVEHAAKSAGLSPAYFHRLFKSVTGVTPKEFAASQRMTRLRGELRNGKSVTHAIYEAGYNSSGRFYANSNQALGMKPKQFRSGGAGVRIKYAIGNCSLGCILVAATEKGVCAVALHDDAEVLVRELRGMFPHAEISPGGNDFAKLIAAVSSLAENPERSMELPLDIQGTAFQIRVWQKLREIPLGETRSYAEIAKQLGLPAATRAVAGACAANRIALAIPCHRVVRSDGGLSGYRWGPDRKAKLLAAEGVKSEGKTERL